MLNLRVCVLPLRTLTNNGKQADSGKFKSKSTEDFKHLGPKKTQFRSLDFTKWDSGFICP